MRQEPPDGTPRPSSPNLPVGPATRPRRQTWVYWVGGITVTLALCCGIGGVATLASQHSGNQPAQSADQQSGGQPVSGHTTAPAAKATATHVAQWSTIQRFTGTTTQKTPLFAVPDEWRIVWTSKKADQYGGNFIVSVMNADGTPLDYAVVNTQDNDGATTYEHQGGGQVYLDVETYDEQWTVQVQIQR